MDYIKLAIIGAVLAVLAGFGWYVYDLRADVATLTAKNQALSVKLQGANDQLEQLAAQHEMLETMLMASQVSGQKVRKDTEVKVRTVLAETLPAKCEDAVAETTTRLKNVFSGRSK